MITRQLVLVGIEHATDVERTLGVALDVAKTRSADVHVLELMANRAVHVARGRGLNRFEPSHGPGTSIGARIASIVRSARRVRSARSKGQFARHARASHSGVCPATPSHTAGHRAQLRQLAILAKRPDSRRSGASVACTSARAAKQTGTRTGRA